MRRSTVLAALLAVAAMAVAMSGVVVVGCSCEDLGSMTTAAPTTTGGAGPATTSASAPTTTGPGATPTTADGPATTAAPTTPSTTSSTATAQGRLPDLVGLDLQLAQDTLQAGGWYAMTSYDATGQDRMQMVDRNWVVVEQSPAAGETVPFTKVVELGVVKKGEPGSEVFRQWDGLPDVVGKNLQLAIDTLQSAGYYLFVYVDAAGKPEIPIVHSNWVVTAQDPAPGTDLATGRVVTLQIEKLPD